MSDIPPDKSGTPADNPGTPSKKSFPQLDRAVTPADNTGNPTSKSGAPAKNSGSSSEKSGSQLDNSGAPANNPGAPAKNSGSFSEKSGSQLDNPGAPAEKSDPQLDRSGTPTEKPGSQLDKSSVRANKPVNKPGASAGNSGTTEEEHSSRNFIEEIITKDLAEGRHRSILTRFPPEPNGYLHIGHAKSINLNFGIAEKYGGATNLRFDDTNPVTETSEYVESIKNDVSWLGYSWKNELFASDYFDKLYEFAIRLIRNGLAYVDDSTSEEIAAMKGTPTRPGTDSPFRNRTPEENENLFRGMRNGDFPEGSRTLRAKIDMTSPNMLMRDPVIYRIKFASHHRTGDKWCIYPNYDFAHGQSDAIENITHSICTLEFASHRELYDWFIDKLDLFPSKQYEFARLNMSYTVMSKRKLLQLVNEKHVDGWDDPRMPTISGLRRRGFTAEAIRDFCTRIGVAKRDNMIDVSLLEFCAREHLNKISLRRMVVFDPVKLVITNWPEAEFDELESENNPEDETAGYRTIPFGRELYIERNDFMEDPPKKYFRLSVGKNVRLKSAFIITCDDFVKDKDGTITEIHCRYHPDSRSGNDTSGIKAKGTLHWVSVPHAHKIEVREYDRLFNAEDPLEQEGEITDYLNPDSLNVVEAAIAEPALANDDPSHYYQFMRKGYYFPDKYSTSEKQVYNRTVTLRDNWTKKNK